ncbi:EamA family transporter [Ornithinimicrobium sp. INDO-MA30-4]|uniref:EamA family transporter n=1 Tax=Ornithinimicrobium sp. INDO-MA30-4 TaxID=2908651 RepID=UPI001F3415D6|nr:EamA family transporter [Ornithinimicrobium sp. INDO-MA30-4]UJH69860.1 EamA family transporter [Ornithinimicrobium sp. INDO-MA30-4]
MTQSRATDSRWLPQFFLLAVLWGCSFAFIEIGLESLTSIQVSFGRLSLGAVTLILIALATRTRLPRGLKTWGHVVVVAALLNALPFTLFAIGQQNVSSILAAIINAATPWRRCLPSWSHSQKRSPTGLVAWVWCLASRAS